MSSKRRKDQHGGYGNSALYLVRRLKRDAPEVCARLAKGELPSARAAAIEAGIIHVPHADDLQLERLLEAWSRADLESRQLFLALIEEEADAATRGEPVPPPKRRRGPEPYTPIAEVKISELEAFIDAAGGVSEAARRLGVSYRTLCRWRFGNSKPSAAVLAKLRDQAT
jgi:hypothetical protein